MRYSWKCLRRLPMVFVDEATEAIAAHDRSSRFCDGDWRSTLGYSQVEAAVGSLPVVMVDVGLQHCLDRIFILSERHRGAEGVRGLDGLVKVIEGGPTPDYTMTSVLGSSATK